MPVSLIMLVNMVILCVLCALVFGGYRDGFLLKLLSILSFFVCGFLAWWASSYVGSFIHPYPKHALPLQDTPLEAVLYDNLNRLLCPAAAGGAGYKAVYKGGQSCTGRIRYQPASGSCAGGTAGRAADGAGCHGLPSAILENRE